MRIQSKTMLAMLPLLGVLCAGSAAAQSSTPYVGEIQCTGANFAPNGFLPLDGRLLAIASNEVLFNLLGTTYGGDGVNTFALPDMRSRVIVATDNSSFPIGSVGGTENLTVAGGNLPNHSHQFSVPAATAGAASATPAGNVYATRSPATLYAGSPAGGVQMAQGRTSVVGSGIPIDNTKPYLGVTCYIAQFGIFPSRD